jgi:uncharacterized protein (DUF433 family)
MKPKRRSIGGFIVVDQRNCRGERTFRGMRVMTAYVLGQAASGMAWEAIVEEWRAKVPRLPREVLLAEPGTVARL